MPRFLYSIRRADFTWILQEGRGLFGWREFIANPQNAVFKTGGGDPKAADFTGALYMQPDAGTGIIVTDVNDAYAFAGVSR